MTNEEIAKKLINNFLKAHPSKKPHDFIKEKACLDYTSCFTWRTSPEGYTFWQDFYNDTCKGSDNKVYAFLQQYFFNAEKDSFINLKYFI